MGCSRKAYYDDLEDYYDLCKLVGDKPNDSSMYKHEREICERFGVKSSYEVYNVVKRLKIRNEKIDDILK